MCSVLFLYECLLIVIHVLSTLYNAFNTELQVYCAMLRASAYSFVRYCSSTVDSYFTLWSVAELNRNSNRNSFITFSNHFFM